jgi:hypothetical protein
MWNPLTFMLDKKQGLSVSDDIVDNNSDTTEEDLSSDDIVDGNSDATEEDPEELATNESLCDLLLQRRVLYFEAHKQDLHVMACAVSRALRAAMRRKCFPGQGPYNPGAILNFGYRDPANTVMLLVIDASRIMQAGAHWPALAALPTTTSALELVTLTVADCFGTLKQTTDVFRQYLKHYHALDVSFSAGGLMLFPCVHAPWRIQNQYFQLPARYPHGRAPCGCPHDALLQADWVLCATWTHNGTELRNWD